MGTNKFDDAARGLANGATRRSLVRTFGAAVLGAGGLLAPSRGAEAGVADILGGDKDDDKTCRRSCLRRCRRARQNCVLSGRSPFNCRYDCEDRCCEDKDDDDNDDNNDDSNQLPWLR